MSQTTKICASSKVSVNCNGTYYTVEYTEERSMNEMDNLQSERQQLWQDVNAEVDNQVMDIIQSTQVRR